MSQPKQHIPWVRYWTPIDTPIHLEDGAGFLSDPEGRSNRYNNPNCLRIGDLLARRCLVLCGEPGMGKTTAIEDLIAGNSSPMTTHQQPLIHVAWETCSTLDDFDRKTFDSPKWLRWLESDSELTLIVDGVDEAFWVVRNFVDRLRDRLSEDVPLHRLRLILACRRLEWPQNEGQALTDLWPREQTHDAKGRGPVFELCPLTRSAVRLAAEVLKVDPIEFFQAVFERQVQALAARPVTLLMLFAEVQKAGGRLSATHRELYRQACLDMCSEPNPNRARRRARPSSGQDVWAAKRLLAVASRIAALSFLTAKPIIRFEETGETAPGAELTLNEICTGQEKDEDGTFKLEERLVQATLETTLFDGKGMGRCGFQHPTYAECLAGQWLSRLPLPQLRLLLCGRDELGEYVRPQLAEVAAWTAAEREDFFDHILICDPGVLLRSDISHLRDERKARLVERLLEKSARGEHTGERDRRVFYSALAHPGLAQQLRPWLLDASRVIPARWLALDIANACHCRALFKNLFTILRRKDDPITRQAGYALDDLVEPELADALIPIVTGTFDPPQPRFTRRIALRALVQMKLWSVGEAVPWLREIGAQIDLMEHWLAERMQPADLLPTLIAFHGWINVRHLNTGVEHLVNHAMNLALDRVNEPEILEAFLCLIHRRDDEYHGEPIDGAGTWGKRITKDPTIRHRIVSALLQSPDWPAKFNTWAFGSRYLQNEDFPWLLEATAQTPAEFRVRFAMLVRQLATPEIAVAHWELLAAKVVSVPEIAEQFDGLKPPALRRRFAQQAREIKRTQAAQKRKQREFREKRKGESRAEMIELALRAVEDGKLNGWVDLTRWLFVAEDGDDGVRGNHYDPKTSPVWKRADDELQLRLMAAARSYLLAWEQEIPREPNRSTYQADAAFIAAWHLRAELSQSGPLQEAFARNYVRAVVWFSFHEEATAELTALLYPLNPSRCREVFLEELESDATTESGITMAPNPFLTVWDESLTKLVSGFILKSPRRFQTVRCLLESLVKVDPDAVVPIWRQCVKAYRSNRTELTEGMAAATEIVIQAFAAEVWNELYRFLKREPKVAAQAILHAATYGRHQDIKSHAPLSEQQIADFYLLIADFFPPGAPEESTPEGPYTPTPRHDAAHYRTNVLNALTALGTRAAREQLARIAGKASPKERIWILRRRTEAAEIWRRAAWQPLDAAAFATQARRQGAFWIEGIDDLLFVVMDSLERLQKELHENGPGDPLRFWEYRVERKKRVGFRPRVETEIAQRIAEHLRRDLTGPQGAIIRREAEVQWKEWRTDIEVIVAGRAANGTAEEWTVTIETKGCWHSQLRTAPKDQLVDRYLLKSGRTHGVYLVAWFGALTRTRRTKLKQTTRASVEAVFQEICQRAVADAPGLEMRSFVLDCRARG